jgi:hypothetical protein
MTSGSFGCTPSVQASSGPDDHDHGADDAERTGQPTLTRSRPRMANRR